MKARQARTSSGVPMFFVSSKEGKKGLFYRSSNNEDYIDPSLGKIHVEEDKSGKTVYVQYFEDLTGYITDVKVKKTFREMPGKGKVPSYDITIEMESGESPIKVMFGFDSAYGRKFAQRFRSIILKEEVTIKPYNFIPKEKEKAVLGLNLYRGDSQEKEDMYKPYYDSDNMPTFETEGRDGPEFDSKAANNWLYKKFIEDVYHAFDHYEEEEKKEDDRVDHKYDPGNKKDYRDDNRRSRNDDDEDDGRRDQRPRNDDRRDSREETGRQADRREPLRGERDRDDNRRDDRRDSRDDDRRDSRDDRDIKRSDGRDRDETARKPREEPRQMSKEEFAAQQKPREDRDDRRDSRDTRDRYDPNAGMDRNRGNVDEDFSDNKDEDLPF